MKEKKGLSGLKLSVKKGNERRSDGIAVSAKTLTPPKATTMDLHSVCLAFSAPKFGFPYPRVSFVSEIVSPKFSFLTRTRQWKIQLT